MGVGVWVGGGGGGRQGGRRAGQVCDSPLCSPQRPLQALQLGVPGGRGTGGQPTAQQARQPVQVCRQPGRTGRPARGSARSPGRRTARPCWRAETRSTCTAGSRRMVDERMAVLFWGARVGRAGRLQGRHAVAACSEEQTPWHASCEASLCGIVGGGGVQAHAALLRHQRSISVGYAQLGCLRKMQGEARQGGQAGRQAGRR